MDIRAHFILKTMILHRVCVMWNWMSHTHTFTSHTIVFTQRANRNKTTYKSMKNSKHVPFLLVQRLQFKRHTHLHSTIYSICIRLQVYCDNSVGKIKKRQLHQLKDNLPSHNKKISANIKQCVAEAYSFKRKVWFTRKNEMTF